MEAVWQSRGTASNAQAPGAQLGLDGGSVGRGLGVARPVIEEALPATPCGVVGAAVDQGLPPRDPADPSLERTVVGETAVGECQPRHVDGVAQPDRDAARPVDVFGARQDEPTGHVGPCRAVLQQADCGIDPQVVGARAVGEHPGGGVVEPGREASEHCRGSGAVDSER